MTLREALKYVVEFFAFIGLMIAATAWIVVLGAMTGAL